MTSRGVARSWDVGGMQGVIDSADTPGGSWTSWTSVVVHGFPGLVEGQEVEFEWNQLDEPADGYDFHTVQAWPVGEDHTPPGPPGFRAWDIDPDGTVHEVTDLDITDLDDTIAPPIGTPAIGVVTTWNGEEGWGVIDSADTPGGLLDLLQRPTPRRSHQRSAGRQFQHRRRDQRSRRRRAGRPRMGAGHRPGRIQISCEQGQAAAGYPPVARRTNR
ncbi:hypothetical protein [Rhodococcus erythropolis]|uniref:hypothetical protein n=1 Tax=Rhodococcus erythropolis TaxID=1833 RepID=UPI0038286C0F